jgi:DNA replication protein DnaC
MSQFIPLIKRQATRLRLSGIGGNITRLLDEAEQNSPSYDEFIYNLFNEEIKGREARQLTVKLKLARLPLSHDLDNYDHRFDAGLSATQMNQLRELNWLDQCYNIMFSGPSGTGKTFISAGFCYDAIRRGYKAYFRGMNDILYCLRLKDHTPSAAKEFKRLTEAQLIVIDDIMTLPLGRDEGNQFFVFINQIYETTSIIITTNKSPAEWARSVDDETLATALLDRLLFRCQLIQLHGKGYRMQNRQTIF